ncbi:MAG: hypothetical protein LBB61_08910 [Treponema sp.]|nr:hypothetical protein [Treponema sp.]
MYISFINLGLPDSLRGSARPSMYRQRDVPVPVAGYASVITCGGTVISSIFSAKVIGRFGTGMVTAASASMTAAALIGVSFSSVFITVCLCAFPLGLADPLTQC